MRMTYSERSALCQSPVAKQLFLLMEEKQTNLVLSADVDSKKAFLSLVDQVGPEICLLKTHIDIIEDFDQDLISQLLVLKEKHRFLIFEDRKFADIGHTAMKQYQKGIHHIVDWADITNAHILPGPGIIDGLKKGSEKKERGLLLLAEMSSSGNFFTEDYTKQAVTLAEEYSPFVIGFISQKKLSEDPRFIHLTPGVKKNVSKDLLGQQYLTPSYLIEVAETDLIIVGRGIYQGENPRKEANLYREEGWNAYLRSIKLSERSSVYTR